MKLAHVPLPPPYLSWILCTLAIAIHSNSISAAAQSTSTTSDHLRDCLVLAGTRPASIIQRDNSSQSRAYAQDNSQWNIRNGYIQPMVYLIVRNAKDVQNGVRCGRLCGVRVVPKGGGHSIEKYSYGDARSMIIDFVHLNQVTINKSRKETTVGAGAILGPVAYALWADGGFVTPLGVCPTVGVAGFTLGGGRGYLSRLYGLSVDNVIEMELVSGSGELLTVNSRMNADLFWALRGAGGGSYGIVTSFTFRLHSAPTSIVYSRSTYEFKRFVSAFQAWQGLIQDQPKHVVVNFYVRLQLIVIEIIDIQNGRGVGAVGHVQSLLRALPKNPTNHSLETLNFADFLLKTSLNNGFYLNESPTNLKKPADLLTLTKTTSPIYFHAKTFYVSRGTYLAPGDIRKLYGLLKGFVKLHNFFMEPYGGSINQVGPSETAFVHRNASYYFNLSFAGTAFNPAAKGQMVTFFDRSKPILHHTESYQNFVDSELDDYLARYYGANLERLIQIKNMVDPDNFFHNPQSIPTE